MSSPFLEVRGLSKSFGGQEVLRDFSLDVGPGEIIALLGRSGSGKSTALRLLAGLETPDRGAVRVAGEDVTRRSASRRGIGMVFQSYALFPHMTIGQNVAFGLEGRSLDRAEIHRRAEAALAKVRLDGRFDGRVGDLSGGMQQRVAIARALAPEPRVLLLDEPFSNLDPELREHTRRELRAQIRAIGITTVFVTHDQEEAFDLGDRVAFLEAGILQQVGPPEDLYRCPETPAVARFIGRSSWLRGVVEGSGDGDVAVRLVGHGASWTARAAGALTAGEPVEICVRPEALEIRADGDGLAATIEERRFLGASWLYGLRVEGSDGRIEAAGDPGLEPGASVRVGLRSGGDRPIAFRSQEAR